MLIFNTPIWNLARWAGKPRLGQISPHYHNATHSPVNILAIPLTMDYTGPAEKVASIPSFEICTLCLPKVSLLAVVAKCDWEDVS